MEPINHYNAIRLRVVGSGNLRASFSSLDDLVTQTLIPLVMSSTASIQPTILSNFMQQRAALTIKTTDIDEVFRINKIIIFIKPTFVSYPQ